MMGKLEEFNEWWFSGNVPEELTRTYKRDMLSTIIKFLNKRQIISIVGLRRVGKTTMMYQLIEYLLANNIKKE